MGLVRLSFRVSLLVFTAFMAAAMTLPAEDTFAAAASRHPLRPIAPTAPLFDPRTYGAKGDGTTSDTDAIQKAIDACAGTGGSVVLRAGTFLSGHLTLKGKMTFYVNQGCDLAREHRPCGLPRGLPAGEVAFANRRSLLYACHADRLVLDGDGTIDGQGQKLNMGGHERTAPRSCASSRATASTVRNISVRNPRMWTLVFSQCTHLDVDGVNVSSPRGYCPNLDGIDICDSSDVIVHHCVVNSEDDSICLKSHGPVGLRRVLVEQNAVRSYDANGYKIGTFTVGPITDIVFRNNTVQGARLGGMCIESVDGGHLSRVSVEGLDINDVEEPIFIRLGHRPTHLTPEWHGMIEDVTLDHVRVMATESRPGPGSTISGIAGGTRPECVD